MKIRVMLMNLSRKSKILKFIILKKTSLRIFQLIRKNKFRTSLSLRPTSRPSAKSRSMLLSNIMIKKLRWNDLYNRLSPWASLILTPISYQIILHSMIPELMKLTDPCMTLSHGSVLQRYINLLSYSKMVWSQTTSIKESSEIVTSWLPWAH